MAWIPDRRTSRPEAIVETIPCYQRRFVYPAWLYAKSRGVTRRAFTRELWARFGRFAQIKKPKQK